MNKTWIAASVLAASVFAVVARAQTQFVDVPPCHWASASVVQITDSKEVPAAARTPELAVNALTQVLEGLKCGDAAWADRFVIGASAGFADVAKGRVLQGFSLRALETKVAGEAATVRYAATVTYTQGGTVTKNLTGTARLRLKGGSGWAVEYASLSALNVPLFPK